MVPLLRHVSLVTVSLLLLSCREIPAYSAQKPRTIEIMAERFSYTPNTIRVKKGEKVNIKMRSKDVTHGFFLDGYGIEFTVAPGETRTVLLKATKTGRFTFRCSKTCGELHPYMVGYLKVTPNTRFGAALVSVVLLGGVFSTLMVKGRFRKRILGIFNPEARFELTRYRWVRRLLKSRWMPLAAILVNLAIFTVIFLAGWLGGTGPGNANFGIMIVWIVWWVLLMILLVPVFARIWCSACPLPVFGDWIQRLKVFGVRKGKLWGMNKKWPRRLRNMWLVNFLFLATTFFTAFFTTRPIYTFVLLGAIVVGDVVISAVYEKRTFCRYLCPVGGFQGLYSNFSMTEIRVVDPDICKEHKLKTCVLGNESGYGCPWMEVPFKMKRNTYCGMCFECFKTCPHDNMALNIRPFGTDLLVDEKRGLDEAWKSFVMVGLAIIFYVIMQGPWGFLRDWANMKSGVGFLAYAGGSSLVSLVLLPALFGAFVAISKKLSNMDVIPYKKVYTNLSYAVAPVGLAAWIAFSFGILFANSSYVVPTLSDPYALGWNLLGTAGFSWTPFFTGFVPYLQILSVMGGLLFALDTGYRLSQQTYVDKRAVARGFIPLAAFLVLLSGVFLWLFVG